MIKRARKAERRMNHNSNITYILCMSRTVRMLQPILLCSTTYTFPKMFSLHAHKEIDGTVGSKFKIIVRCSHIALDILVHTIHSIYMI
jgi:hypothetical protein